MCLINMPSFLEDRLPRRELQNQDFIIQPKAVTFHYTVLSYAQNKPAIKRLLLEYEANPSPGK